MIEPDFPQPAFRLLSPGRADIEPTEIPFLLPHIALVGAERAPVRLMFRLIGTHITESLGRDNTGKYFDEAFQGQMLEDVMQVYGKVLQAQKPVRHIGRALYSAEDFRE